MAHSFITHTFSECVENHAGMETIGKKREVGLSNDVLRNAQSRIDGSEIVELGGVGADEACVLVVRGGVNKLLKDEGGADKLWAESLAQPLDKTFLNARRKVVQNKHGRHNNCYANNAQEPDVANGKGTIVAFDAVPVMSEIRSAIPEMFGDDARELFAETNFYPDVTKRAVGIGFHGASWGPPSQAFSVTFPLPVY